MSEEEIDDSYEGEIEDMPEKENETESNPSDHFGIQDMDKMKCS